MKTLSKLKQLHPLPDDLVEIVKHGFEGDLSSDPKYITDGHAIFLREGLDESLLVKESDYVGRKPKPEDIEKLWVDAQAREDISAAILGTVDPIFFDSYFEDEDDEIAPIERAILRDDADRIIYIDAFKLAFLIYALSPDALSVAKEGGNEKWVRFSRGGALVGCLMPMRSTGGVGEPLEIGYDIDGEALPLEIVVSEVAR